MMCETSVMKLEMGFTQHHVPLISMRSSAKYRGSRGGGCICILWVADTNTTYLSMVKQTTKERRVTETFERRGISSNLMSVK